MRERAAASRGGLASHLKKLRPTTSSLLGRPVVKRDRRKTTSVAMKGAFIVFLTLRWPLVLAKDGLGRRVTDENVTTLACIEALKPYYQA